MNTQFLLSAPNIKRYFDTGENPPISELLYLHTHPLILPNFLSEINDMIKVTTDKIIANNIQGKPIGELVRICEELKEDIVHLDNETGLRVLSNYRDLYNLCEGVINVY
jgi:hypothetical protein